MSQDDLITEQNNHDCDSIRELIAAYGMGLTDPDESALVERILPDCPDLQAELADYEAIAKQMLFSVPVMEAPAHIEQALLDATSPVENEVAEPSIWKLLRTFFYGDAVYRRATTMAIIAVVLLVFSNLYWINEVNKLRDESTILIKQLAEQQLEVLQPLGEGNFNRVELVNSDTGDPSNAILAWVTGVDPRQETWVAWFVARELPQLPQDNTYQLWLTRAGEPPISAGVFTIDESGVASVAFEINIPIGAFDNVGVTTEPLGGSTEPSSTPIIMGDL